MNIRNCIIVDSDVMRVIKYLESINEHIWEYWDKEDWWKDYEHKGNYYIGFCDDEDQHWDIDGPEYWKTWYRERKTISFTKLMREDKLKRILND